MEFLDRTEERKLLKDIIHDILQGSERCIWIEGKSGTGKSYLLRYMIKNSNLPVLYFEDYNWHYKCRAEDIDKEYEYIIHIVNYFQEKHPKEFNDFLTNYFENLSEVSWIEALALLVPNIKLTKWAKDIVNAPLKKIESSKNEISNMLYASGVKKCFSKLILDMLLNVEHKENIVICIDDACWLDEKSISTLKMLLNILTIEKKYLLKVSLIIVTRSKDELFATKNNYDLLETELKEIFGAIHYFQIRNFNYSTTREYVKTMNREFLEETVNSIFEITAGNPQELFQTLKFNDKELLNVLSDNRIITQCNGEEKIFSIELILKLAKENIYTIPSIFCTSILTQEISTNLHMQLVKNIIRDVFEYQFNNLQYEKCVKILLNNDILKQKSDIYVVSHDSIKEIVSEYLKHCGDYVSYLSSITKSLRNLPECIPNQYTSELLFLYNEYNSSLCFEYFTQLYNSKKMVIDSRIIKIVSECTIKEMSLFTDENLNRYIVPVILKECVFLTFYESACEICKKIYSLQKKLNFNMRLQYLTYFAKVLIDSGHLVSDNNFNAISIVNELIAIKDLNSNQKIQNYLIAMSAYEHILDYKSIIKYSNKAEKIYRHGDISNTYKSIYLRNQGLIHAHRHLETEYLLAIEYANKITDIRERNLALGTCYNNLGLCYLYLGKISIAFQTFQQSQKYLEAVGYDTFRVINNLAICLLLENKYDKAYEYFLQAKALNLSCVFERLCIQSNLAIVDWKLGHHTTAKESIEVLVNEYKTGKKQTADDLIYSSAMVNLGYFLYCEDDFVASSKAYKESLFFDYRYDDELQRKKRKSMINACLYQLEVNDMLPTDIDIKDSESNIFSKMYAPIAFAYYVI